MNETELIVKHIVFIFCVYYLWPDIQRSLHVAWLFLLTWLTLVNDGKLHSLALCPQRGKLRLVWPAFCVTGKCSLLGTVRSFLESFYFFFSISFLVSLVLQTTQRVHLTMDFIDLGTKYVLTSSPELSLAKNGAKIPICGWNFQLVSAWWMAMG